MINNFKTSINEEEIAHFEKDAQYWWDENGPFKPLHQLNPLRLSFIKNHIQQHFLDSKKNDSFLKFNNLKILDVGCGGGLLTEPLARLGATVTGIDASETAIKIAKNHAYDTSLTIDYHYTSIENLQSSPFDIICALEIIEHVQNPSNFMAHCAKLLKPNGLMFISTLNRTWQSYFQAIIGAEYILKWVQKGTHDWNKFLNPSEIAADLRKHGLKFVDLKGLTYNLLSRDWQLSNSLSVNYIGCVKFTLC